MQNTIFTIFKLFGNDVEIKLWKLSDCTKGNFIVLKISPNCH